MKRFEVHFDHHWSSDVRELGAPIRLYIRTPWGWWMIGEKSQVYDRKTHKYTDRWSYVTYRPPARRRTPLHAWEPARKERP